MKSSLTVPLLHAAHGRTGDKGNRSNISVIAWHPELYPLLVHVCLFGGSYVGSVEAALRDLC